MKSLAKREAIELAELNRLLVIAEPLREENIIAYLLRLTELNAYDKLAWILSMADLSIDLHAGIPLFYSRGQDLSKLVRLSGISEARLRLLQYRPVETNRQTTGCLFFEQEITSTRLCLRRPKVCPACLRQFGFISRLWDLSAYTACVEHKCLLIDKCPQCGGPIRWSRNQISRCGQCRSDWTSVTSPSLQSEQLKAARQIHRLCSASHEPTVRMNRRRNPLLSLNLDDLLTVLYFLARRTTQFDKSNVTHLLLSNAALHKILNDSWNIFEDWPGKFWDFLDAFPINYGNKNGLSVSSQFGGLYTNFLRNLSDPCFDFIKIAFDDYLRERWNGKYEPGRQRLFRQRLHKNYLSEGMAARRLGSTKAPIRRLIQHNKISAIERRSHCGISFLIDPTSLDAYRQQLQDCLSTPELQSILGIGSKGIEDLIKQDFLHPLAGPTVDGGPTWKITRDEVLSLNARIEKTIRPTPHDSKDQLIGFNVALRLFSRLGASLTQFLQAILDKQIVPCGATPSRGIALSRLRFDKQTILKYVQSRMDQRKRDALFLKEAATELGIVEDTAYFLRDKGILKVEINRPGLHRGSLITRTAIEEFKSNYASAGELARTLNTSPNRILELLASKKVYPITGPSLDGCYQYLFRRSDVQSIDVDLKELSIEERMTSIRRDPRIKLTVNQIADILQINVQKVNHLIESGLLSPLKPRLRPCDRNVFNGYTVLRYMRLMDGRDDIVSGPVAAKMLDIGIGYLPYFVRTGKLKPVTLKEEDRFKYFRRADVERLICIRETKKSR